MMPRYSARTPPSSLTTFMPIPHIVSSVGRVDVWNPDVSAGDGFGLEDITADAVGAAEEYIDAVAMDNLERTRSSGYVVPDYPGTCARNEH